MQGHRGATVLRRRPRVRARLREEMWQTRAREVDMETFVGIDPYNDSLREDPDLGMTSSGTE